MIYLSSGRIKGKSKVVKMSAFLHWYQNKVQAVTPISNESFINIMQKL